MSKRCFVDKCIQLFRPKFIALLAETEIKEIVLSVITLIQILGSPDVALDGRHTPALYSRFILSLLKEWCPRAYRPMIQEASAPSHAGSSPSTSGAHGSQSEAYYANWPSVPSNARSSGTPDSTDMMGPGMAYQRQVDDFSLTHFVKTVTQDMPHQASGSQETGYMAGTSSSWRDWSISDGVQVEQLHPTSWRT